MLTEQDVCVVGLEFEYGAGTKAKITFIDADHIVYVTTGGIKYSDLREDWLRFFNKGTCRLLAKEVKTTHTDRNDMLGFPSLNKPTSTPDLSDWKVWAKRDFTRMCMWFKFVVNAITIKDKRR